MANEKEIVVVKLGRWEGPTTWAGKVEILGVRHSFFASYPDWNSMQERRGLRIQWLHHHPYIKEEAYREAEGIITEKVHAQQGADK